MKHGTCSEFLEQSVTKMLDQYTTIGSIHGSCYVIYAYISICHRPHDAFCCAVRHAATSRINELHFVGLQAGGHRVGHGPIQGNALRPFDFQKVIGGLVKILLLPYISCQKGLC